MSAVAGRDTRAAGPAPRPVTPASILAATLQRLAERVDSLEQVPAEVRAELHHASRLASGLDPYLDAHTTPESPALRVLAERTRAEDWGAHAGGDAGPALEQEMLSGHVEGQALKFLVRLARARRVLDIGMFTGYSALAMAEALPDGGEVVACEVDPDVAALARECLAASPAGGKVTVRVGPAMATLTDLADAGARFDVAFIDADKAGYRGYLDLILERDLVGPDGLICVDNTLMQGQPWASDDPTPNGWAIAAFNRGVADDPRVEQVLLPLRDGLTLIRRA